MLKKIDPTPYVLVVSLSAFAYWLHGKIPAVSTIVFGILLGMVHSNIFGIPEKFKAGVTFCEKKLLSGAIILLGLQLDFQALGALGSRCLLVLIPVIGTLALSFFLSKFSKKWSVLIKLLGVGHAICGSAAIAATSKLYPKSTQETAMALALINVLGTIALFCLPSLLTFIPLKPEDYALVLGVGFQAVGHVVGAATLFGPKVVQMATTIKMARVALLLPVMLIYGKLEGVKSTGEQDAKSSFPLYLIGFVLCAIIRFFVEIPPEVLDVISKVGYALLLFAMTAVGLKIKFKSFIEQGPKALLLGMGVFLAHLTLTFLFL